MRRFWIKFELTEEDMSPPGIRMGIGVTAYDYTDGLNIIRDKLFKGDLLPAVTEKNADVDISKLDQQHVAPNIGNHFKRGIWFPQGY